MMSVEAILQAAKTVLPENERGGNLFTNDNGDIVFWSPIGDGWWLEFSYFADNYPHVHMGLVKMSPDQATWNINHRFVDWIVLKCNLDGVQTKDGRVVGTD